MTSNRVAKIAALVAALLVAAAAGPGLPKAKRVRAQTVTVEPFVGIQVGEISPRQGDPPIPRTYFQTVAVRSDGSISRVSKWEGQTAVQTLYSRQIVDARAKTHTVVDPLTESIVVQPYDDVQTIGHSACSGTPADQIQGFDVVYSESTETLKDGSTMTAKKWKSPKLGCYPLVQEWIAIRRGGELIGDTKHSLVHIKLGEPDPWYFDIPKNYTARTSEEWTALITARLRK